MNTSPAFTKLDLLILLVIAVVLIAILAPALKKDGGSRLIPCATNLKSIGTAVAIYAAGNQDHLPVLGDAKSLQWLCDEPPAFTQSLESIGSESTVPGLSAESIRKWFYCPQNPGQDPAALEKWNGISVWGYAVLNDRGPGATSMPRDFPSRTPPQPALQYRTQLASTTDAADAELALDWIISDSANPATARFTGIVRPGSPALTFDTSHLSGEKPHGANVLAFDNHVEWRNFDAPKGVAIGQGGAGAPYFWVPNP